MVPQVPWWFLDSWNRHLPRYITPNVDTKLFRFTGWGEKKTNGCIRTRVSLFWRAWNMGKKKAHLLVYPLFFLKPKVFSFKGRLVARWSKRLEINNQQVVLKVASFFELKPCVTKHPKKFDHFPSRVGSSPSPPGMFEYIFEDTLQLQIDMGHLFFFFSACLDDDSSGFVLFLVCFVSSESSATIHASRISGFLVFTAVPLSLCHVKATLYTVNRWSQACLQNWKPPVSPNFGAKETLQSLLWTRCVFHQGVPIRHGLTLVGMPSWTIFFSFSDKHGAKTVLGMNMASIL